MKTILKSIAIGLSLIAGSQAMDVPADLNNYPKDETLEILRQTSIYQILELGNDVSFDLSIGNFRLVCKNWQTVIDKEIDPNKTDNVWTQKKKDFFINSIISAYKTIGQGKDCEAFLNGKLIYTPHKGEQIVLLIANLKNPFSDGFDLSKCGIIGDYYSVNTGCRKRMNPTSTNKIEVWFTPWFSIEKNLNSTAPHLESIFTNWNQMVAPIGIIFNGDWYNDNCDYFYVTDQDIENISSNNLLNLLSMASPSVDNYLHIPVEFTYFLEKLHICFNQ